MLLHIEICNLMVEYVPHKNKVVGLNPTKLSSINKPLLFYNSTNSFLDKRGYFVTAFSKYQYYIVFKLLITSINTLIVFYVSVQFYIL